jgi:phosphatidylinositol alpha-1,6-mannosyltransferase
MTPSRIFFGANSFQAGIGGIARVARLMGRVLLEELGSKAGTVQTLSFADHAALPDLPLPQASARRSKLAFAARALGAARWCSHFIYDGCQLAQVHQLPGLRRKPMLTYIHGIEVWEHAPARYLASARRAAVLLSPSDFTKAKSDRLHGGFSHVRVCRLATEDDAPPPLCPPMSKRPPCVLIVGRLVADRPKGHQELIECWPKVVALVPEATLSIVGGGPDVERLRRLAANARASHRIYFHGAVPEEELQAHYSQARVFAMPSRGEGFGLVYVEAMRHGLPVIGSVHDAAPEIIEHERTGYVINQDNRSELADCIIRLLLESKHAQELGEAGRKRWQEHFRFGAFRSRFSKILTEFLTI